MQPRQSPQTLVLAVVIDEPTRRLGEQQDQESQDDGRHDLDAERDAPLRRPVQVEGAITDPAGDEGSNPQHELLQRRDAAADGRMGDLSLVDRDDHDQEADSQPGDAPTGPEVLDGLRPGLEAAAQDEDDAADDDGPSPPEPVARGAGEHGAEEGSAREETNDDSTGGCVLIFHVMPQRERKEA